MYAILPIIHRIASLIVFGLILQDSQGNSLSLGTRLTMTYQKVILLFHMLLFDIILFAVMRVYLFLGC